jgi:hypothetical protein
MPLRLKSPSRPWPTASCSSTPASRAQHHVHLARRAGDGVQIDQRLRRASSTWACHLSGADPGFEAGAAAGAGRAGLALAVLLDRDLDVEADQRAHVAQQPAVGAQDLDHAALAGHRGHHLDHARIAGPGEGVDLLPAG